MATKIQSIEEALVRSRQRHQAYLDAGDAESARIQEGVTNRLLQERTEEAAR